MQKIVATFPDTASLSDFILENAITSSIVNSKEHTLTTQLTDEEIEIARTQHYAYIVKVVESIDE